MSILFASLFTLSAIALLMDAIFYFRRQKLISQRVKGEIVDTGRGIKGLYRKWSLQIGKLIKKFDDNPFIQNLLQKTDIKLKMAGQTKIEASTFIGSCIVAGFLAILISYVALGISDFITLLFMGLIGYFFPVFFLNSKIKKRQIEIFRDLPDALDILTLLIEAGLDFGAALNILIEKEKGPLIDELAIAQQEIKLGASRIEALNNTIKRVKNKHLTSVLNTLIQSMQTGASIGDTLRALSDQYRTERALFAEKLGSEAPLKMMGPLILFIFPTIFIIIFGPLVLSFIAGKIW